MERKKIVKAKTKTADVSVLKDEDTRIQSEPEWFTTPEVAKILGLRIVTLQDWIVRGYVVPQEQGVGYGSKHHFSKKGILQIRLFRYLVDNGLSRKEATRRVELFSRIHPSQKALERGFLQFTRNGDEISVDFLPEPDGNKDSITAQIKTKTEEVHLINLGMLMDEVDQLLRRG